MGRKGGMMESVPVCGYFEHDVVEDGGAEFITSKGRGRLTATARDRRRDALALVQTEPQCIPGGLEDTIPVSARIHALRWHGGGCKGRVVPVFPSREASVGFLDQMSEDNE
jgi:hypothetical protein